jgi:hypothetical protein
MLCSKFFDARFDEQMKRDPSVAEFSSSLYASPTAGSSSDSDFETPPNKRRPVLKRDELRVPAISLDSKFDEAVVVCPPEHADGSISITPEEADGDFSFLGTLRANPQVITQSTQATPSSQANCVGLATNSVAKHPSLGPAKLSQRRSSSSETAEWTILSRKRTRLDAAPKTSPLLLSADTRSGTGMVRSAPSLQRKAVDSKKQWGVIDGGAIVKSELDGNGGAKTASAKALLESAKDAPAILSQVAFLLKRVSSSAPNSFHCISFRRIQNAPGLRHTIGATLSY